MQALGPRVRVTGARHTKGFELEIVFESGEKRTVDLTDYLQGPIFKPIREDNETFKRVAVVGGVLIWGNGADIDPDVLYYNLEPARQSAAASPEET